MAGSRVNAHLLGKHCVYARHCAAMRVCVWAAGADRIYDVYQKTIAPREMRRSNDFVGINSVAGSRVNAHLLGRRSSTKIPSIAVWGHRSGIIIKNKHMSTVYTQSTVMLRARSASNKSGQSSKYNVNACLAATKVSDHPPITPYPRRSNFTP